MRNVVDPYSASNQILAALLEEYHPLCVHLIIQIMHARMCCLSLDSTTLVEAKNMAAGMVRVTNILIDNLFSKTKEMQEKVDKT